MPMVIYGFFLCLSQVYGIDWEHDEADSNFLPVFFSQVTT